MEYMYMSAQSSRQPYREEIGINEYPLLYSMYVSETGDLDPSKHEYTTWKDESLPTFLDIENNIGWDSFLKMGKSKLNNAVQKLIERGPTPTTDLHSYWERSPLINRIHYRPYKMRVSYLDCHDPEDVVSELIEAIPEKEFRSYNSREMNELIRVPNDAEWRHEVHKQLENKYDKWDY
jgi:hypothetical protein